VAEALAAARKARAASAAKQAGLRIGQASITIGNRQHLLEQSGIVSLPSDVSDWMPIQVLDTTSPNCGAFYFLPGYDSPGDPNKIVR
jgi:hypothetical protein